MLLWFLLLRRQFCQLYYFVASSSFCGFHGMYFFVVAPSLACCLRDRTVFVTKEIPVCVCPLARPFSPLWRLSSLVHRLLLLRLDYKFSHALHYLAPLSRPALLSTYHVRRWHRLWHLTRLDRAEGFDETWINDAECYGHNSGDVQPFHDMFPEYDDKIRSGSAEEATVEFPFSADGVGGGVGGGASVGAEHDIGMAKFYYTNMELYDLLDPRAADSPYVYDNFEWPHCDVSALYTSVSLIVGYSPTLPRSRRACSSH